MADFYSGFYSVPNGGAQYRLHLIVNVVEQDVIANTSTLEWFMIIEKDRSYRGFYDYYATWTVVINGSTVDSGYGQNPTEEWYGWDSHIVSQGRTTVIHDTDGHRDAMSASAEWARTAVDWSPGTMSVSGSTNLPVIPRATEPTVTPSPAVEGSTVTISLPRKVVTYTHNVTWKSGTLTGTIGTGLGTSTTWTVPTVMGEFPGKPRGPIVITAVTKSGAVTIGTKQVTLFAQAVPELVVGPNLNVVPNDPRKQFDVRARLVTYDEGAWGPGATVPASVLTLVDPSSATTTCSMDVSGLLTDFADDSIVDIDIYTGTDWLYTNHRLVLSRDEGDEIDPSKIKKYSGVEFIDHMLANAYTQKDYEWGGDGTPAATTPGEMMRAVIADAQARGWGPLIDFDFSATETSYAETWANTGLKRSFNKGTPLSQVLSSLVEEGLVEYATEYHDDKAFLILMNPGTGANYATNGASPIVNFSLAKLSRAPKRRSSAKRLTAVTVAGDDKVQVTRKQAPYDADVFGQMEGWVSASGVTTDEEAQRIGDNALRDNSSPTSERTFEYSAGAVAPVFYPYYVFRPGDWVKIPDAAGAIQDRLSQITINKQIDGTTLTALTGDRILSGTASLAKRQAAQTGGSIAGGNQSTPSPLDSRIPSGPVIGSITSQGYWNSDGAAKSAVTISYSAVTESLNGSPIVCDLYETWWRPAVGGQWAFKSSTDQIEIEIDGWDVLADLEFRVRARSAAGIFGQYSTNETHTTAAPAVDLDGPIIADIYTDGVGSIYIVWAGVLGTDPAPARLAYVVAEVSTDGGSTYTTEGTPIAGPGTIVLNKGGVWGSYMVRLRGYDRLGNAGDASDPETIVLIDPHIAPPIPEAPTGLTSTAGAAWDATGIQAIAWFDLEWDVPTLDTVGNPIDISGYDIWGKRSDETVSRFITSSVTNLAKVAVGQGEEWSFEVKSSSVFGGVSAFSAEITDIADASIAAPSAPSAPTLSQYAGLLRILWAGGGMVPQVKYVFASISTVSGGTFTRAGMPLNGAGEVVVPGLEPGDYYAKINLVDELGQIVSSAEAGPITLLPITGVTIQTSPIANTGIKMTNASLTAYDVSGNPTFILDAITGEVWIAPYDAVFDLGASGATAESGTPTTGLAISSETTSFNTFFHSVGVQIRNDQTPISWWEADATDASLVNFFSPRAYVKDRLRVGDYEFIKEQKTTGTRLVTRYKGA